MGHTILRPDPDNENIIIAEYKAQGNADQVFADAERSCQNILTALRYALVCMIPTGSSIIGKLGESPPLHTASERQMASGNTIRIQGAFTVRQPFTIEDTEVQAFHNFTIFEVANLLETRAKTDLQEAITNAIHWCATASTETSLAQKHLHLIQALETIFSRGRGPNNGISRALRNGICCILGTSWWKEIIQHQYSLRSAGAHGTEAKITEKDIIILSRAVTAAIPVLLNRQAEFPTRDSLKQWVETERYKYGLLDPEERSQRKLSSQEQT
jgi:hypothetical protein